MTNTVEVPEYLTIPDLAARARTTVSTVRYWRRIGYGPHGQRIGRRVIYRADDVTNWLLSHFVPVA